MNAGSMQAPRPAEDFDADDPRVVQALREYHAALESGRAPDRREFQARYADVAGALGECLDGLEFLHTAAPHLQGGPPDGGGPAAEPPPLALGDFRIVREIGRGGMGVVYEAEQLSLARRVALKVLPFAATLDSKHLQRFKKEAQAAALLHHTNIVPVFAVGCERGVHYYAMQFIDGRTLAAVIAELREICGEQNWAQAALSASEVLSGRRAADLGGNPLPTPPGPRDLREAPGRSPAPLSPREGRGDGSGGPTASAGRSPTPTPSTRSWAFFQAVARLGIQAAEALEHAHQLGIVHRDVKPANLLVEDGGHLWVTDFGLARFQSDTGVTQVGDLVGTLRYMSPEQAQARAVLDHRTDIYSLGVTLYELVTLRPAFAGRDRQELQRRITHEEPRPPRKVNPAVPAELETVLLKAAAKAPEDRYATAQELADDLRRFLEDRPLLARRPTLLERIHRLARRHRQAVFTGGLVLVLTVVVLAAFALALWQEKGRTEKALEQARRNAEFARQEQQHAQRHADEAERQRKRAESSFRRANEGLAALLRTLGDKRWEQEPGASALRKALAEEWLRFFEQDFLRGADDPTDRYEAAKAYALVGGIYATHGEFPKARHAFAQAESLVAELLEEEPGNAEYASQLGLIYFLRGTWHHESGDPAQAQGDFRLAVEYTRRSIQIRPDPRNLNNLAWYLLVCPEEHVRQPAVALHYARQAVQMSPRVWSLRNTLGVAYYYNGEWDKAIAELKKSNELSGCDSNSLDCFYLAMAHWKRGDPEQARHWFGRGEEGVRNTPWNEPVNRYRAEAAALLGIAEPPRARDPKLPAPLRDRLLP